MSGTDPDAGTASAQDRIFFAAGKVSLVAPPGFRAMTEETIRSKFPRGNPPQHVYANDRMNASVAITLSSQPLTPEQLPKLKSGMEQTLPRLVPGLEWLAREIVENNGTKWIHFELTSHAIDTDIHNHMYMTSWNGRMLGFNFNSTIAQYENNKVGLARSKDSIRIDEETRSAILLEPACDGRPSMTDRPA